MAIVGIGKARFELATSRTMRPPLSQLRYIPKTNNSYAKVGFPIYSW